MTEEVLPEIPLGEDSVQSQPRKGITLRTVAFGLAVAVGPLWLLFSGLADCVLGSSDFALFLAVAFSLLTVFHVYRQPTGKGLRGLLVDHEGITDQQGFLGRVLWDEIKAIYPIDQSFFGFPIDRHGIALEVTDTLLRRKSAWKVPRTKIRYRDIQLSTPNDPSSATIGAGTLAHYDGRVSVKPTTCCLETDKVHFLSYETQLHEWG